MREIILFLLINNYFSIYLSENIQRYDFSKSNEIPSDVYQFEKSSMYVDRMVRKWAPLVYLAPEEKFYPVSVDHFLQHVTTKTRTGQSTTASSSPLTTTGANHEDTFLVTKKPIDEFLRDSSSILYGINPNETTVPVYAYVTECNSKHFYVSYWLFFPFNEGKTMCTLDMGLLGPWPIPHINNKCLGTLTEFGNHVGDWEHTSFLFKGRDEPDEMYVSVHDSGAYYKYDAKSKQFIFNKQETRKGFVQRPTYPSVVKVLVDNEGTHPVFFAAKGSHGLWTAPGKHRYVRMPRLYDVSGYGTPWQTWKNIYLLNPKRVLPKWMHYFQKWGNPRSGCHPLSRMGLEICNLIDGPTGIPSKKHDFQCINKNSKNTTVN